MVERLAKRWDADMWGETDSHPHAREDSVADARWWLNAVADELEAADEIWGDSVVQRDAANWLRTQAREDTDDG